MGDEVTYATQEANARARRASWAIEELQVFDRNLRRAWTEMRDSVAFLNASAGIDGKEAQAAIDRIEDLLIDSFANHREQLLRRLDDEGGAAMRGCFEIWPFALEMDATA